MNRVATGAGTRERPEVQRAGVVPTTTPAHHKHVALFVPSMRGGGAERVMSILARGLSERDLRVDLVLVEAVGPYLADIPAGVRIVDLKRRHVLTSLPGLVRYLRQERPDALLSTQRHANVIVTWAKSLAHASTRVVIRQADMLREGSGRRLTSKERLIIAFLRRASAKVDAVVTLNATMADEFVRAVPGCCRRVRVINNPVPVDMIQTKASEPLSHSWFKPGAPPVILSAGRLSPCKDFATLIDAFATVRASRPVRLMILGEGELRDSLQARVDALHLHNDVALPGFASNPYKYMRHASLFVLPSRWEGFPNALVEAMACGTPVIATNCPGGSAEILENGRWGELVPVGDPAALAQAILKCSAPSVRSNSASRIEDFSLATITAQYVAALGVAE